MKLPFDKTYCLHLSNAPDRYEHVMQQFANVGIDDQVEFWWTCRRPFAKKFYILLPRLRTRWYDDVHTRNENVYEGVFNCAIEHYTIIKTAYERGLNSVCVIEDDIIFAINKEKFELVMNSVPDDFDVIQYHIQERYFEQWQTLLNTLEQVDLSKYTKITEITDCQCSTLFYALGRRGMKHFIDTFDKFGLTPSDVPFAQIDTNELNYYTTACEISYPIYDNSIIENG